jgi:hypothetical protein
VRIEVVGKHNAKLPEREPGKHLWIAIAMFQINPTATRYDLDGENLLTIEGPGCYWCEQTWGEAAHLPCKGE